MPTTGLETTNTHPKLCVEYKVSAATTVNAYVEKCLKTMLLRCVSFERTKDANISACEFNL